MTRSTAYRAVSDEVELSKVLEMTATAFLVAAGVGAAVAAGVAATTWDAVALMATSGEESEVVFWGYACEKAARWYTDCQSY